MEFQSTITTEDELRAVLRPPHRIVADKTIDHIDEHCRSFIERSPFILIASSDGNGHFDVSPKGDPAGFVRILDDRTLAVPERPGNHRADTFTNVLQHPHVGLIFLVPGVKTTLRVAGQARIVADSELCESMAINGKAPKLALVIDVEEAMLHCAKCVVRSKLWNSADAEVNRASVSSLADAMVDMGNLEITTEEMNQIIVNDEQKNLY